MSNYSGMFAPGKVYYSVFCYFFVLCSSVLGRSSVQVGHASIRDVVAGASAVWVCTSGGHLLGFHPLTADVLVVQRRSFSLSFVLPLCGRQLLTFGRGALGLEEEEEEENSLALFTVWDSYISTSTT